MGSRLTPLPNSPVMPVVSADTPTDAVADVQTRGPGGDAISPDDTGRLNGMEFLVSGFLFSGLRLLRVVVVQLDGFPVLPSKVIFERFGSRRGR